MRHLPLLLPLLAACAPSVIPDFEAARAMALRDPGPAPESWKPDATLLLAEDVVDDTLEQLLAVHGSVDREVSAGPITARPKLAVRKAELHPARCPGCSRIEARLKGELLVSTPLGTIGAPVRADIEFDAVFAIAEEEDRRTLTLAPRKVRKVDVSVAGTDLAALTDSLTDWLSEAVRESPPLPLAELGGTLPIRDVRVVPTEEHVRLDLLTATPDPVAIGAPDTLPEAGWRLDLSTDALLDLARAASFRAKPLPRDLVAEPTSLYLGAEGFVLGLRLWRVKGRGWWRDYTIRGELAVVDDAIELTPAEVQDEGRSQGAAWADPLAALGQGVILKTLERALETSVPAVHKEKDDALRWVVDIDEVQGHGATVSATGSLRLEPKGNKGGRRGR